MNRPFLVPARVSAPPTPRGSNESVFFNGHTFKQGERFDRIQFHRPSVGDPFVSLPTAHQGRFLPAILLESDAQHLQDKALISVELTGFRVGGNYPRVTCKQVGSLAAQPLPAAAKPLTTLDAVLTDLTDKIKAADTAQALVGLTGNLRRATTKFSGAAIQPATDSWVAKAADMIEFYISAKSALGWSQAAVNEYDDMAKLITQLSLFQPQRGSFVLPARYRGQLTDLSREHAWTKGEVEQKLASQADEARAEQARLAIERAEQALANNPFRRRGMDALMEACQAKETHPELVSWLEHITNGDGANFLQRYPLWTASGKVVLDGLMAYFKAVLAKIG